MGGAERGDQGMIDRGLSRLELAFKPLDRRRMRDEPRVPAAASATALLEDRRASVTDSPGKTPKRPSAMTVSATVLCHSPPRIVPMLSGATHSGSS